MQNSGKNKTFLIPLDLDNLFSEVKPLPTGILSKFSGTMNVVIEVIEEG